MNLVVALSFVCFTCLVAVISYLKTKKESTNSTSGHFFANKKNNFWVIGGALLLSNISANQFVGENESIFINNMSVISWGVSSVLAMLLVSEFMLPIYFKTGALTIPGYLEQRYDASTKQLVSLIFLMSYLVNLLPSALYGGAVAMIGMLNIFDTTQISYWSQIWILVWAIGVIGTAYTILGGLRAITISDTVLSLGLLVVGVAFPYYGFRFIGNGDWLQGIEIVLSTNKEHLNSIGGSKDAVPLGTIFTGMFIMNLYYWGMEQYIIQQALTAKSLSHSQKGMALACIGKLLSPFLINIPGIISVFLYTDLINTAEVFPKVINDILPSFLTGLTAAVVFGAAITTFNAGLSSSSTLFILNFYQPFKASKGTIVSDHELVRSGRKFEIIVSMIAMFAAPFIFFSNTGFYAYLQQLAGMFSIPVFTIVLIGFFSKKASPQAAKYGIVFFICTYILTNYILELSIHFLHLLAILFVITAVFMIVWSTFSVQKKTPTIEIPDLEVQPWKNRHWAAFVLIILMILVFVLFSPLGIA